MTPAHSKTIAGLALAAMLAAPAAVLAQAPQRGQPPTQIQANICGRLTNAANNLRQRLLENEKKLNQRQADRRDRMNDRQTERATKQEARLNQRQDRWLEQYEKLLTLAETDAQKQAVAEFRLAIETAWRAKQTSLQKAITDWQLAVQAAIAERDAATAGATSAFQEAIKTATDKAAADCQAGADPATVRSALMSMLDEARDKFKADRQSLNNLGRTLAAERESKQVEMRQAVQTYKAAVKTAVENLRAVLTTDEDSEASSE